MKISKKDQEWLKGKINNICLDIKIKRREKCFTCKHSGAMMIQTLKELGVTDEIARRSYEPHICYSYANSYQTDKGIARPVQSQACIWCKEEDK